MRRAVLSRPGAAALERLEPRQLLAGLMLQEAAPAEAPYALQVPLGSALHEEPAASSDPWVALRGPDAPDLAGALQLALSRYADFTATYSGSEFADFTNADGTWKVSGAGTWVAGFTPGVFWQLDRATRTRGDVTRAWAQRGEQWARRLMTSPAWAEDVGFRMISGLDPLRAKLAGEGRHLEADAVAGRMMEEALLKNDTRWNQTVGAYRTAWRQSTNPQADYGVLIDQTYDLVLLQWLASRVGTSDPTLAATLRTRVGRHVANVANHLVRPDGSSFHWGYFNSGTGQFVQGETYQGYSNDSTWARGQAWGILGLAEVATRASVAGSGAGDEQTLATARSAATRMADWFLAHLPTDSVPFWDFDDPAIPNAPRDSSAAAIAASGLLTLAGVPGLNATAATSYRAAAKQIMDSLAANYTSAGRHERSVLIHGAGNVPAGGAVDRGLIYGDYFFLRAYNQASQPSQAAPPDSHQHLGTGGGTGRPASLFAGRFSNQLISPGETHAAARIVGLLAESEDTTAV